MSNPVSLKQLEILVKIVECGGLSEAAVQLNVSPSAVSKSLSQLENQLGTTLLKRTTRSFTLTEPGQYLYNRATQLLLDFDESVNTTAGYYNHPQGELRITCSMAFGYSHLVTLVNHFRKNCPDVDFHIDLNDNFVNLNEVNVDIALRVSSSPLIIMLCANWRPLTGHIAQVLITSVNMVSPTLFKSFLNIIV